jgi:hypothetical protein
LFFTSDLLKFTISNFSKEINLQKENTMYEDKKKSKRVYVESKCVSRDDCCWDETPETEIVVADSINNNEEN